MTVLAYTHTHTYYKREGTTPKAQNELASLDTFSKTTKQKLAGDFLYSVLSCCLCINNLFI